MKAQKILNVVLVILIIVLVSVISFGGIYYKDKNKMSNHLPDYIMGTDLKGYRQVSLCVCVFKHRCHNIQTYLFRD